MFGFGVLHIMSGGLLIGLYQTSEPGSSLATALYNWWYSGLGGLGGWSLFLLLALIAAAYVFFDSANRNIKAAGWRLATLFPIILLVPTFLYKFSAPNTFTPRASEWFLVVGVLGVMISIASAIGYAVSYWGVTPSPVEESPVIPPPVTPPSPSYEQPTQVHPRPVRPRREVAPAWLLEEGTGRQYQLYRGDTRIGRKKGLNDIVLDNPTVSREHALIREESGVFTLYDRGSKAGTYVNGRRLYRPVILYHGDVIQMGEVQLTFVTAQR